MTPHERAARAYYAAICRKPEAHWRVVREPAPGTWYGKAEKPALLAWLRRPHPGRWFAAIADSGQKHVIPYAPINPVGSRGAVAVMFEEREIRLPPYAWIHVEATAGLLTAGATKDEVARGDYEPAAWGRCAEAIRAYERAWAVLRGGAWFDLALFLAQRDEAAVQERMAGETAARAAKVRKASTGARRRR